MKHPVETIVFLSAELSTRSDRENLECTEEMDYLLKGRGYQYFPVQGKYRGLTENSFAVIIPEDPIKNRIGMLLEYAKHFGQESILIRHADRTAELLYTNMDRMPVGIFTEVSKEEAEQSDGYTIEPQSGRCFILKAI